MLTVLEFPSGIQIRNHAGKELLFLPKSLPARELVLRIVDCLEDYLPGTQKTYDDGYQTGYEDRKQEEEP